MYVNEYDKDMSFNKLVFLISFVFFLHSCADYQAHKKSADKEKIYHSSVGFALIYEENHYLDKLINKKLNNDDLATMHVFLKTNTPIKIINPANSKVVETKIFKRANYPKIFNLVISKKIATLLELDINNPYIELIEVKKNKTFIAKESNIFDEEKNVSGKAPVNEVKMDDLSKGLTSSIKKLENNYSYIVVINDFYYFDSANNLKKELIKKIKSDHISIEKINNNKYRLFVGPFKNFNALKTTYISLNNLGFENLNIFKELNEIY